MADNEITKFISVIALLVASLGASDNVIDSFSNELSDYYICNQDAELTPYEFLGGTSKNGYTGYPYAESRTKPNRCGTSDNNGIWMTISDVAKELGVTPYDLMPQEEKEPVTDYDIGKGGWECFTDKPCVQI